MSDCDLCDCEVRGTIGTYVLRSIAFSGQFRDNNGPARRRPTHSTSAVASPFCCCRSRSRLSRRYVVAACDQRLVWRRRGTIDALQALANGQRSVEDPSGRLRNYAAGCLINVRQIMADHRDAQ